MTSTAVLTRHHFVGTSFGPLFLMEKEHAPGAFLAPHDHAEANFTFVVEGGTRETVQGRDYACGPGSLLVKPADARHVNRYDVATCSFVVAWFENRQLGEATRAIRFEERGPALDAVRRMYAVFGDPGPDAALLYEELLGEILLPGPAARRRRPPRWLVRVHDRVVEEARRGLGLRELAREASVNPEHLSRAFRAHYGIRIGTYAERLRVEWAASALARTDRPIAAIALGAGFSDQSHLTRAFRRALGTTPARFRRAHRDAGGRDV